MYATACSVLVCLLLLSPIVMVSAEEMPTKEQLTQQITQQAKTQVAEGFSESNNQTEVVNTGNSADVQQSNTSKSDLTVTNQNDATVTQTSTAEANTGGNEASRNISIGGDAGVINTGNATTNTTGVVSANNNTTAVSQGSGSGGSGTSVTNTGNGATTSSSSNSKTSVLAANNGTATIVQAGTAKATTGNNKADRNISIGGNAGVITTGAANANMSYLVAANNNKTAVIVGGSGENGPGSGASIYVINTGNNGGFTSQNSSLLRAQVANNNQATVTQSCGNQAMSCSANTGNNTANRGIAFGGDAGVINTGNAVVNVQLFAQVNKNTTGIGIGGSGVLGGVLGVVNTGDTTQVSQNQSAETDVHVANNNQARVTQTASGYANTGNNTANRNISFGGDAGVINTGDATVNVVMVADVNSNENYICVDQPYCELPTPNPTPTPTPTPNPSASPTPTPTPSTSPSPTPTPNPSGSPQPTPTPTPGVGGGGGNGGSSTTITNNYYYPTSTSTTTHNHSIGKVLSDFAEAVTNPGQVLAATTEACPPCSATAFTGDSSSELPAWQRVLKGVVLLSVGYGLATARYKLPKFVGTK